MPLSPSYTWSDDKVTFQDMASSTGSDKAGFKKIKMDMGRLVRPPLQSCNVPLKAALTCSRWCVDKISSTDLSKAINSMYRYPQLS
ncbi:uncharacterized protein BCR38DRAFT_353836 [Pseudomassariella vexata]|uniref:Uncharacterized protein n=1 Tax=Pseudomassariella vexata TaxID=1141098 RepID=A0A1Y2DF47_9PEZI|nr:uncharacterized protein BCR38DRAFT_353836 [Pseudomassariella vexata]ORY57913.1 hypothetical protein BCR38DRAFT_353836 [Pseudomassariella vexata]